MDKIDVEILQIVNFKKTKDPISCEAIKEHGKNLPEVQEISEKLEMMGDNGFVKREWDGSFNQGYYRITAKGRELFWDGKLKRRILNLLNIDNYTMHEMCNVLGEPNGDIVRESDLLTKEDPKLVTRIDKSNERYYVITSSGEQYLQNNTIFTGIQEGRKPSIQSSKHVDKTKVFVVHGHDEETRKKVCEFLVSLQLMPIVLHEQANEGMTVIEKFEKYSDVPFAVILLTPDDRGYPNKFTANPKDRARQNVIFELGYFFSKLDRSKVVALIKDNVEKPSDIDGIVYVSFDKEKEWQKKLIQELHVAGMDLYGKASQPLNSESLVYTKMLSCGCLAKDGIIVKLCPNDRRRHITISYEPPVGYSLSEDVSLL